MADERIQTQKFEEVETISVNSTCHICLGNKRVKVGQICINRADGGRFTGFLTKWKLCESCRENGWEPIESTPIGQHNKSALIMYRNASAKKNKSHQVWNADISSEKDMLARIQENLTMN